MRQLKTRDETRGGEITRDKRRINETRDETRGEKTRDETRQDEPGLDDRRLDKKRRAVVYDR